jgi:DNA-binding winged helix-turn-helix (wHTH) protein
MSAASMAPTETRLRFGAFEVDFSEWQLRKLGVRIKLQRKPFQILRVLLERRGELVTRTQLAQLLWPDLHVEYERSLNTAINCLRQSLSDTAKSCRYIETCPGLGYRFIGAVEVLEVRPEVHKPAPQSASAAETDYRKGRFFYDKMTADNLARAKAYFESAVNADPRFALAHAGLGDIQCLLARWSVLPGVSTGQQARYHAQCALAADPQSADAHVALANAKWLQREPWSIVEVEYRRAIAIDGDCVAARLWYASLLSAAARHEEAAQQLERAQRSEPLSLLLNHQVAWSLYTRRAYRPVLEQSWDTLMLDPGFAPAQYTLGLAYEQLGMLDDAITEFGNARRCSGEHPAMIASQAHALSKAGCTQEAEIASAQLEGSAKGSYCSPYWMAIAAVGRGDHESALAGIDEAGSAGDCLLDWLAVEPRFDPLRQSPRFQKWLRLV